MKTKSISFAEVLKKTTKSPRAEATKTAITLEELVHRFQADPDEDYTLYLGRFNASQKRMPSSFQMTFSRNNGSDSQEEIFDSWIQKQSAIGSNKENIRNQPQRSIRNEPPKRAEAGFRKIINNSKSKENAYATNSTNSQRQWDSKTLQVSEPNYVPLEIEMIKSKGYQSQQNVNRIKSPKNEKKFQPPTLPLHPSSVNIQHDIPNNSGFERQNQIKVQPTFKEIKELKESEKAKNQYNKPAQKLTDYKISSPKQTKKLLQNKKVDDEISDIASKYLNPNYSPEAEVEEELLLENPSPPPRQPQVKTKKQLNQQMNRKRMEEAKKMIGNCLVKLKKDKQQPQPQEKNDIYLINPHYDEHHETNIENHMVGYSFSNKFMGVDQSAQNQQTENQDNYIPDVVSEAPDEVQDGLNDSSFKNKYLNLKSFEAVEQNQHIQNIQSVKYEAEDYQGMNEYEKPYEIPNDTFKAHLIMSKDQQNRDCHKVEEINQQNTVKNQINSFKEEPFGLTNYGSYQSNHALMEAETVNTKAVGKSRQKISLISSKSKSNKSSPAVNNKPQKQSEVATTDFTIDHLKNVSEKTIPQKTDKSFEISTKNEQRQSYSNLLTDKQQCSFKTERINNQTKENTVKESFHASPTHNQLQYIPYVVSQKKDEEPLSNEYFAPSYAKPTSRLADITSDYYSSPSYVQPNPKYEPVSQYQVPSYASKSNLQFASPKTVENFPLKVESPFTYDTQKQIPKENTSTIPTTNSYEQKYALPTSYFSEKETKKNYLQKLDIKESITVEEPKTRQESTYNPTLNNPIQSYTSALRQFKTINPIVSSRNSFKVSLKQSINVSQSEEFVFDL